MNQREADLIEQMTQIGLRLAELTAENKILKSVGEAQSQSEGFYCADWNRCGAICEEQCPACKKADRAELL